MSLSPKMSYNAAMLRVRCDLTRAFCLKSEAPPVEIMQKATARMEQVKATGEVQFYLVFDSRLAEVWKAMRADATLAEDQVVRVTLAAGAPLLPGISLEKAPLGDKALAMLSIAVPAQSLVHWRWEWFKLAVFKRLRDLQIREAPNPAQLFGAFTRARQGEKIASVPIGPLALATAVKPGLPVKPYSVIGNKQRMEVGVALRSVKELRQPANREALLALVNQAVRQLSSDGTTYTLLKKDFLAAVQSALEGPELVGVDMPTVILSALGRERLALADYPGAAKASFAISPDRLEATISGFELAYYRDPSFVVGLEWLKLELKRCRITEPMSDAIAKALTDAIASREDLNGKVACRGEGGVPAQGPFIHPSYRDAASRVDQNLDSDRLDIRELQQRVTVKVDQLVAEIRYRTPGKAGRSVFGEQLPIPPGEVLTVRVGEGVVQRDGQRYFATADGIPIIDQESVALTPTLVHKGDVNLRTGNIRFDGPVEIQGSVDMGAVVEVSGDLTVTGSVLGGTVRARGSITVMEGVTTGTTGLLQAGQDITAQFIENSTIVLGGTLRVAKAVINCRVYAGGAIEVTGRDSTVAGGRLLARESLTAYHLGFKRGAVTTLDIGADWRIARTLDIRKGRLAKLQARAQQDRQSLRELVQRTRTQLTAKHKEMKESLTERLGRFRKIMETIEGQIKTLEGQLSYNPEARIMVKGILAANVALTLGGQIIAVQDDVASVAVVPKRRRGSFIVALEDIEAEERASRSGGGSGGRKAS